MGVWVFGFFVNVSLVRDSEPSRKMISTESKVRENAIHNLRYTVIIHPMDAL